MRLLLAIVCCFCIQLFPAAQVKRSGQFSQWKDNNTSLDFQPRATNTGRNSDNNTIQRTQNSTAFTAPDTVCINSHVTITNTSVGATNYYWNFCVANASTNPIGTNLGNYGFSLAVFVDYAKDGNNYYAFVTNNMPGKLVRLDFGNSLLNTPTAHDFGNLGGVIPD